MWINLNQNYSSDEFINNGFTVLKNVLNTKLYYDYAIKKLKNEYFKSDLQIQIGRAHV